MKNSFQTIIAKQQLTHGLLLPIKTATQRLLFVHWQHHSYLIEDRCGHFGVTLSDGSIEIIDNRPCICCRAHGICFFLDDGNIANRPFENCHPIKCFALTEQDNNIGFFSQLLPISQ